MASLARLRPRIFSRVVRVEIPLVGVECAQLTTALIALIAAVGEVRFDDSRYHDVARTTLRSLSTLQSQTP